MDLKIAVDIAEIFTAVGTWCLAGATWWLATNTLSAAKEQHKIQLSAATEQRNSRLFLQIRKDFDSPSLRTARVLFAKQLLAGKPHDEMNQEVLTFFEDVGMLVRRYQLDREMVWDTFGHFAKMWWSACKEYIATEQSYYGNDPFFFRYFKFLVEQIYEDDIKKRGKSIAELEPSPSEVNLFLATEAGCRADKGLRVGKPPPAQKHCDRFDCTVP